MFWSSNTFYSPDPASNTGPRTGKEALGISFSDMYITKLTVARSIPLH